jgi:hypothetical protein
MQCAKCGHMGGPEWDAAIAETVAKLPPLAEEHRVIDVPFEVPADHPRGVPLPTEVFVRYREQLVAANLGGLEGSSPVRKLLLNTYFPALEDAFHWFVTLDCGCTRDLVTRSADKGDLFSRSDEYFDTKLPAGQRLCGDPQCPKPRKYSGGPVRDIAEWTRRHDDLHVTESRTIAGQEFPAQERARWDVTLACGHTTTTQTEPDWQPEHGYTVSTTKAKVSLTKFLTLWEEEDDKTYWKRVYTERFPTPTPFMRCDACANVRSIKRAKLIGPLASKQARPEPAPEPDPRSVLEERIRQAEDKVARMRKRLEGLS